MAAIESYDFHCHHPCCILSSSAAMSRERFENVFKNTKTKKTVNKQNKERLTAIITGASSGIGLGITHALLERGYRVVANSRKITQSKDLKPSADLVLVDGDIGKKDVAVKVAEAAVKHFGGIDLLVNN